MLKEQKYKIVRFFNPALGYKESKIVKTGPTLEEAKKHCCDPRSCRLIVRSGRRITEWFDGFLKQKR